MGRYARRFAAGSVVFKIQNKDTGSWFGDTPRSSIVSNNADPS